MTLTITILAGQKALSLSTRRPHPTTHPRIQAEVLDAGGVEALVYKGVALSAQTQGHWQGRQSVDVDVLVDRTSVRRAHQVLVQAGLRRTGIVETPSPFKMWHAIETSYAGWPVGIDLHWDVEFPGYLNIPFRDLWERRQQIALSGLRVSTLSRPDALLVSALHGTREEWRFFRQVLDFAEIACQIDAGEWQTVVELSEKGAAKSVAVALVVASAAGCEGLPAQPTVRGMRLGSRYIRHDPRGGRRIVGQQPIDAIGRRWGRWQCAPSTTVALRGLGMAVIRQIVDDNRSWRLVASR